MRHHEQSVEIDLSSGTKTMTTRRESETGRFRGFFNNLLDDERELYDSSSSAVSRRSWNK